MSPVLQIARTAKLRSCDHWSPSHCTVSPLTWVPSFSDPRPPSGRWTRWSLQDAPRTFCRAQRPCPAGVCWLEALGVAPQEWRWCWGLDAVSEAARRLSPGWAEQPCLRGGRGQAGSPRKGLGCPLLLGGLWGQTWLVPALWGPALLVTQTAEACPWAPPERRGLAWAAPVALLPSGFGCPACCFDGGRVGEPGPPGPWRQCGLLGALLCLGLGADQDWPCGSV